MRYHSTRGQAPEFGFEEAVLAGLATDGGLYLPSTFPVMEASAFAELAGLPYAALAEKIMLPFTGGELNPLTFRKIVEESYATFRHEAIAPLKQLGPQEFVLELFHGPTLAFKDFALQFLGRLLSTILAKRGEKVVVVGATSGDTGSAAIAGCRGLPNMDIVILYPEGRVSEVQRRQMTTFGDANVHPVAIKGNFDDCQSIVKALFTDLPFREKHRLVAVNSINWARILAQTVYYIYAALALGAPAKKVSFSVPTGNFGDIYAGYLAKKMGLPVGDLIIASNRNDILTRCYNTGEYKVTGVHPSYSPSMDIQVSSNFERLLFDLYGKDANAIHGLMGSLKQSGSFALSAEAHQSLKKEFKAHAVDDETTLKTIRELYESTGEILDPHTAVGVKAARETARESGSPVVTLATAHPAKFPDAVEKAIGIRPALPPHLADLFEKKEKTQSLPADAELVKSYIQSIQS